MAIHEKMKEADSPVESLSLLGGKLCLDFINTLDPRIGKQPREFLRSYSDLVAWEKHVGLLTAEQGAALLREAESRHADATKAFEHTIVLREALYRVFVALTKDADPQSSDLEIVQQAFAQAMLHARLEWKLQAFDWAWLGSPASLDSLLWPIVRSALDLLISEDWKRVRQCPGIDDCGWLFLDTSKNGSRQWCSMQGCGSRAKMRRQYARKRAN